MVKKRIKGVAITDHDTNKGYIYLTKNYSRQIKENNLIIIPGIEITLKGGHILLYNYFKIPHKKIDIHELIDEVHDENGVIVLAHPLDLLKRSKYLKKDILSRIDGLEVANGSDLLLYNNAKKLCKIARQYNLMETAGSDSHLIQSIAQTGIIVNENIENPYELFDIIKNRKHEIMMKKTPLSLRLRKIFLQHTPLSMLYMHYQY